MNPAFLLADAVTAAAAAPAEVSWFLAVLDKGGVVALSGVMLWWFMRASAQTRAEVKEMATTFAATIREATATNATAATVQAEALRELTTAVREVQRQTICPLTGRPFMPGGAPLGGIFSGGWPMHQTPPASGESAREGKG